MNKKVIKYLICIIIISAILILGTVKDTTATISDVINNGKGDIEHSVFKTSKNLFCLNKGDPFARKESFTLQPFSVEMFKEITGNQEDVDTNVLKYIISESNTGRYGDRTAVGNYIPQIAIWKLAGATNFDNVSQQLINEADTLIANSYAYKNFIDAGLPEPTIEKYGDDGIAIKYFQTSATYNGVTGNYANLLVDSITVTGATYRETEDIQAEDIGNGNHKYYKKRIYIKDPGVIQPTVSFNYETSRTANFKIFKATDKDDKIINFQGPSGKIDFLKIENEYYHNNCHGYQEPCSLVTIEEIEQGLSEYYNRGSNILEYIHIESLQELKEAGYKFYRCTYGSHSILAVNENRSCL